MMLATVDPEKVFSHALAVGIGIALVWNGRKTWRGEEEAFAVRYERKHGHPIDSLRGPMPGYIGTRRRYRSSSGSTYGAIPFGLGFLLMELSYALGALTGEDVSWWLREAIGWVVAVLVVSSGLFMFFVYPFFGAPDWLRPPCQRGWKEVGHELRLVRPEAFREHPKRRQPSPDDRRAYDPWR